MNRINLPLLVLACASSISAMDDAPLLWTPLSFDEARAKAGEEDRILVVYGTASWCGPCRQMERTTWRSPAVVGWFREHGMAFKLDVDEMPDLAGQLWVQGMPSLIAFREGEMFDRTIGYQSEVAVISWLEDVRAGRRAIDRLLEAAGDRVGPDGRVNIRERLDIARKLAQSGAAEAAVEEFLWLWDNMLDHDPSYVGVRASFMISDMERLAFFHEGARAAFRERRAQYWPRIEEGTASREEVLDWVALTTVTDEFNTILDLVRRAERDPKALAMLKQGGERVQQLLIEHDRWADLAVWYDDPVEQARNRIANVEASNARLDDDAADDHVRIRARAQQRQGLRNYIGRMYAVLLAAGRDAEADEVATILLEHDDTTAARGMLVTTALDANQPRPRQMQWIEEAEQMGASVPRARRELAEALGR